MNSSSKVKAPSDTDPQKESRRQFLRAILKAFILPVALLAFYLAAPVWLNTDIREHLQKGIEADKSLSIQERAEEKAAVGRFDFEVLCTDYPQELRRLHGWLVASGYYTEFRFLHWAQWLAGALLFLLASGLALLAALSRLAQRSQAALIRYYRLAWHGTVFLAVIVVCLLVPLEVYGIYEFFILLDNSYSPILMLVVLGLGGVVIWTSLKTIWARVPLIFGEAIAREISPEDSPELWQALRAAAERLGTSPPNHVIVGMQHNFYVTELAVRHTGGQTQGKTLYLSYPLMKQMPEEEVIAFIGHELGHFIGEDTGLSRVFYPLRQKVRVIRALYKATRFLTLPAYEVLDGFGWCFEGAAQTLSRTRELEADQKGAHLTTTRTLARALVRLHVASEAFQRGILRAGALGADNPYDIRLSHLVGEKLPLADPFWPELFHQRQSHPMDTHPSLRTRLNGLGENIAEEEAHAILREEVLPVYDVWFAGRAVLFDGLIGQARQVISEVQYQTSVRTADINTPEGRAFLDSLFPPKSWAIIPDSFRFWLGVRVLGVALFLGLVIFIDDFTARLIFGGLGLLSVAVLALYWVQRRGAVYTVDAKGISCTTWRRSLAFPEIKKVSFVKNNSLLSMVFALHKEISSPAKFSWGRGVIIPLHALEGESEEIGRTIVRYMFREVPPQGPIEK